MEFSWLICGLAFLGIAIVLAAICVVERLDKTIPPRYSKIDGTDQQLLHARDYWWFIADLLGLPLIISAFFHLVINKGLDQLWWGLATSFVITAIVHRGFLGEKHKPDSTYPRAGKASLAGYVFLLILWVGMASVVMCIWNLITGDLRGPVMWAAGVGGVFYILCFILDVGDGHFQPLKLLPKNGDPPM